jgi:hypothetical protein
MVAWNRRNSASSSGRTGRTVTPGAGSGTVTWAAVNGIVIRACCLRKVKPASVSAEIHGCSVGIAPARTVYGS